MATFLDIASPLVRRGIPVIPVALYDKAGVLKDQFAHATTDLSQIVHWNSENPDYNVGCVAKPDGIVVLDCDVLGLKRRIEHETGHKFPPTLTVRSAGKGCDHLYFRQTDVSRELGNQKGAGLFDLQSVDKYVVGPGSILDNGRTYDITDDSPIADFPHWLENWILAYADIPKKRNGGDTRPVDESFDIADLLEHYEIGYRQEGEWYITDVCPIAGRKHEQSTRTGFFFDGSSLGFHCFASGCEGSTMTIGQVIKFLNQDHQPYKGTIWEEEPIEDILDEMGVKEEADSQPILESRQEADANPAATGVPSVLHPAAPEHKSPLAFPEHFMYGEAKILAGQMKMPLGLAYMALLGEFAIKCDTDIMCGTRVNTYTALIAPVGGGKNVAMDRAKVLLGIRYKDEYLPAAPAGTRALMNLIGDKPSGKRGSKERSPGPQKLLLVTHEMTDVLRMTGVDCSTLASRLCDFWDDNEHVYPTGKDGVISVDCRLHWIGGVPASAENPTRFTELFDSETSHGLYDRLLIGYSKEKFNYRPWEPPAKVDENLDYRDYTALMQPVPFVGTVSEGAQKVFDDWTPVGGGSRIKQNGIKIALIATMMNHEETVTEECMRCAIGIMEWQVELRKVFQPGEALNDEAKCRVAVLAAMQAAGAKEAYVNIKRIAHDRKWGDRFGDRIVRNTISNLGEMGEIMPKLIETEDGQKKSKSQFKLRDWSSVGGKSGENGEGGDSPSTNSRTLINNLQT